MPPSLMNQPPSLGERSEHSCLEVISQWNVGMLECNQIRDLTPHIFDLLFKTSLFVHQQQPASSVQHVVLTLCE